MEAASNEEWEEVVALDGKTYRVLKNTPPPTPPLPLSDSELSAIDAAIGRMAKVARRRGLSTAKARQVNQDADLCKTIDEIVVDALVSLRGAVKDDSAEKLFDRLHSVCDTWEVEAERYPLGIVFIRFMNTMEYLVAYRGKFRGVERRHVKYSKAEAHEGLRLRGLTKK